MNNETYFVLNIKAINAENSNTGRIYNTLSKLNVNQLNIPFIPLKSRSTENKEMQVALPHDVDPGQVFKLVSSVRDELDVTLVGAQSKEHLITDAEPSKYGLNHFILGETYEGLDK